jgi:integrase
VSLQKSWATALDRAGWILAGRTKSKKGIDPLICRFHDLRHTAVTRMVKRKVPIPVITQLVGWSPSTMWEMAKKYAHFYTDDLRGAVEDISLGSGSPPFPRHHNSFTPTKPVNH